MHRIPLSRRFPWLTPAIVESKILFKKIQTNTTTYCVAAKDVNAVHRFYQHESLLRRKLGDSDPRLQELKICNLKQAVPKLNGLVIQPQQTLSFWQAIGRPSPKNGFVTGMLISNGKVVEGQGGGLCQLANLLYWLALHSPLEVVEHHHHSLDIFPDSGRVLPFGSGASVFYNYIDLQLKNPLPHNVLLKVWLSDSHLHGELWCDAPHGYSYKVKEQDHGFYHQPDGIYRTNKLYQYVYEQPSGKLVYSKLITHNKAKVLYPVPQTVF